MAVIPQGRNSPHLDLTSGPKIVESFGLTLGDRGRAVLPAALRERLHVGPGDKLILQLLEDGTVRMASQRQLAHNLRGLFRDLAPGVSLADELIAERRVEARRDEEEAERESCGE